jgi:4-azaleucine resistance transporter AzlC
LILEVEAVNGTGRSLGRTLAAAFPHTVPVLTGYLVLGMAYGVLMQAKGYGAIWAFLMSAVAFCGSMQFVAITLLTGAFDPVGAVLMSLMVNARHLFYGVSMLGKYRGMGWAKVPLVYTLSDETFSIVSSVEPPEGMRARDFYLAVSVLDYIYWVGGSVLGALAGKFIRFDTTGLDFALTGLFVVLFIEQVKNPENRRSGVIGMACTVAALAVFGADKLVIPAMILVLVVLLLGRKKL